LCQQDLPAFLAEAKSICKYNQQRYDEHRTQARKEFPTSFLQFIDQFTNA